jgi:hypothetical protein
MIRRNTAAFSPRRDSSLSVPRQRFDLLIRSAVNSDLRKPRTAHPFVSVSTDGLVTREGPRRERGHPRPIPRSLPIFLFKQKGVTQPADIGGDHFYEYELSDLERGSKTVTDALKAWAQERDHQFFGVKALVDR